MTVQDRLPVPSPPKQTAPRTSRTSTAPPQATEPVQARFLHARRVRGAGVTAALVVFCGWANVVAAQGASTFDIDDENPESSVPTQEEADRDPVQMAYFVMELGHRADRAEREGAPAQAARYYRAMAKAMPRRAAPFSKACEAHATAGDAAAAIEMCEQAVTREGTTAGDVARYVHLIASQAHAPNPDQRTNALLAVDHLESEVGRSVDTAALRCSLATRLSDEADLAHCVADLEALAPSDTRTFVYSAALAVARKDWDGADAVLQRAKKRGLEESTLTAMRAQLEAARGTTATPSTWALWALPLIAALVGLLGFIWRGYRPAPGRPAPHGREGSAPY